MAPYKVDKPKGTALLLSRILAYCNRNVKGVSYHVPMNIAKIQRAFLHAGFKYLKLELEAEVNPEDYDAQSSCVECDGRGSINCPDCDGSGGSEETCSYCEGRGYFECDYCYEGYTDNENSFDEYLRDFEQDLRNRLGDINEHLKYLRIYRDGSVDTEATLTLRVDYLADLPEIVKAFKKTCLSFGSCGTYSAGIHLTLLEGYKYPRSRKLNQGKIANYKKQIAKLLLGLVYLGSNNGTTRHFQYRDLKVSANDKYSAIFTHHDTCIEFRLFDTCYDQPEQILNYLSLMAKTLRFYTMDQKKAVGFEKVISVDTSEQILNKHHSVGCLKLMEVYKSRESRIRLFDELFYLVNEKGRRILSDLKQLNPSVICPELFTLAKQYI